MAHTPGPWKFQQGEIVTDDRAEMCIGNWTEGPGLGHAAQANARLIAAAPDLLADLRTMRDLAAMVLNRQHAGQPIADRIWSDLYAATNKASATLAKAEGA